MMERDKSLILVLLSFGMALLGLLIILQDHHLPDSYFALVGFSAGMLVFTIFESSTEAKMARAHEEERAKLQEEIDRLEAENRDLWRLCYGSIDRCSV